MDKTAEAEKRLITHSRAARKCDVCTKTLDRWVAAGILSPPTIINNRKYHIAEDIERVGQVRHVIQSAPDTFMKVAGAEAALHRVRLERETREPRKHPETRVEETA